MNKSLNINWIIISRYIFMITLLISWSFTLVAQPGFTEERTGWWRFNNVNDPLAPEAGFGLPLELVGSHQVVQGSNNNDHAVRIGVGSYYKMSHGIPANGGGSFVNEFSLQIDFKIDNLDMWHCFFQTFSENTNDGDCFINPSGKIGVAATGYSANSIEINEWYRLVIVVDNGTLYNYYLDGELINQGIVQETDGRFSLEPVLLMFADEDGEDNVIDVSEISIWDRPLSSIEVSDLGGFSHPNHQNYQLIGHPFLQSLTQNSVYVCWHDTLQNITRVEYGLTQVLGSFTDGTSEMVTAPFRWHSVQLTNLVPGTKYFYRLVTGSVTSQVFSFKTLPGEDFNGHIRFLLFSDSQEDSAATGNIVRKAKSKVQELYGNDISDNINLIMHTGDIVSDGSDIQQWTDQFFKPFAPLSGNIPFLSVAGNHELEHQNYYTYIKYNQFSAFPETHPLFEKIWTYRMPGILFIGMNSNLIYQYGDVQQEWLDSTLASAEDDPSIDFVFCFLHHPPVSELWGEGNTAYVAENILGVLKKYSKVQQLSYGHTHAYEMGVVESTDENSAGDFRISCVGSGGGDRDRWGEYTNNDYPEINMALDHYFYILFDFNLAEKSYTGQMFDLGNSSFPVNNIAADIWHRRLNQAKPDKPVVNLPTYSIQGNVILDGSEFSGADELMTSQFQISSISGDFSAPIFTKSTDWRNYYGVDGAFNPVNLNEGLDITSVTVPTGILTVGNTYYYRVRYRDQNLRWSDWSEELSFVMTNSQGINMLEPENDFNIQVSPNPFYIATQIAFELIKPETIAFELYSNQGKYIKTIVNKTLGAGSYVETIDSENLTEGVYFLKMKTPLFTETRKIVCIK